MFMMQKSIKLSFLTIIIILFSKDLSAQFTISAEYRPRFEVRDGYKQLQEKGSIPTILISQRTRLSFCYKDENLFIKFTPQDVRIWGDEQLASSTGVFGDASSLDMFEAFAEIKLAKAWKISIGRQQLVYDNERLLGKRNWNQNGIAYDAILLKYHGKLWNLDIGSTWNTLNENLTENLYLPTRIKTMNFLWVNRSFNKKLTFSFMHMATGVTETDSTNKLQFRQTSGIYGSLKKGKLNSIANFYYQYGKNINGKNISAFLFDIDISYQTASLKPGIGISYLSGNNEIGGETDKLFDVFYGLRHRLFGEMDYFTNFPKDTKEGGLNDMYIYLHYDFSNKINLNNTFHYFRLAQTNQNTPQAKELGYENDLIFNYSFYDWGSLRIGYIFFLPDDNLKVLKGINDNKFSQFIYAQLTLKPELFKHIIKK